MDSVSLTVFASIAGILTFLYTYIKDRYENGKSFGKLEERVLSLEQTKQALEQLTQTLTETRLSMARLEQKVDNINSWINEQK